MDSPLHNSLELLVHVLLQSFHNSVHISVGSDKWVIDVSKHKLVFADIVKR